MPGDFKPMLAFQKLPDVSKLVYPLVASPKLDGIRCVIQDGKALSRTLKPIPNKALRYKLERSGLFDGLDGELFIPGEPFQATTSAVMSHDGDTQHVEYHVFDFVFAGATFQARYSSAAAKVTAAQEAEHPFVKLVPHTIIRDENDLAIYERAQLDAGYEGVMLRSLDGLYKFGRSTLKEGYLLKLKRFEDAEAVIIGFEEKMHNDNEAYTDEVGRTKRSSAKAGKRGAGTLGAFVVQGVGKDFAGVKFSCGGQLTDADRAFYWTERTMLMGKTIKYKFQRHGSKDAPRSPIFLGIRAPGDM